MKKTLVLLLTLAMLATMVVGVSAEQSSDGTIAISNSIPGVEYKIYRVFDLDYVADAGAYRYTLSEKFATLTSSQIVKELDGSISDITDAALFAKDVEAFITANSIADDGTATVAVGETGVSFSNLPLGYYFVDTNLGTLCALTTTDKEATVVEKNPTTVIDKDIIESGVAVEENNANIGDAVNYTFDFEVTNAQKEDGAIAGATGYIVTDTMTAGLTFNEDLKLFLNNAEIANDGNANYEYAKTANGFTVDFTQAFEDTLKVGDVISAKYSATINEAAVIAPNANTNTVNLKYGENATFDGGTVTVKTYTFDFDIFKYAAGNKTEALEGAEFTLWTAATGGTQIKLAYDAVDKVYRITTGAGETIKAGEATVSGLEEGTYWLQEEKAPAGYNELVNRVQVTIAPTRTDNAITGYTTPKAEIENKTGTALPETGGAGTVAFTVVGSLLMLAAVVLFTAKKKMSVQG